MNLNLRKDILLFDDFFQITTMTRKTVKTHTHIHIVRLFLFILSSWREREKKNTKLSMS